MDWRRYIGPGILVGFSAGIVEAVVPYCLEGRSATPGKEALERLKALGYIH